MALKAPKEILQVFNSALVQIRDTAHPLTPADRNKITEDLSKVYNYVSATIQKPSLTNALYASSAKNAKLEEQLAQERVMLREHQQFVETNFDKAEQYLRTIQLGGYAVFFALWSITGNRINSFWGALAVLLMLVSATAFVIWEVNKSITLSFFLKRHASIGGGKVEDFLKSRMAKLTPEKSVMLDLAQSRPMFLFVSIIPAIGAVSIMLCQLIAVVSRGLFG